LHKNTASYKPNNKADDEIRRMELMMSEEQQSSTSSKKGLNTIVNVISNFS
jgi:hypothetical protein